MSCLWLVDKPFISLVTMQGCIDAKWKFYNLLTGANKSSYIDSFLDRSLNTTQLALGINAALHGDERYKWFIDKHQPGHLSEMVGVL